MAQWNSTWPQPLISGYRLTPHDQTVRTDMEVGFARVRRRTTARHDKVNVSWQMSNAQFTEFRLWFDDSQDGAGGGSIWFEVPLARAMAEPFAASNPYGMSTAERAWLNARFVGTYSAALEGNYFWLISAELELRSRTW
jgi:hypothetical protein